MDKVVVIQGAGMDMRGKVQVEIFGPDTLEEINTRIEREASELGLGVVIFQSNDEAETVAYLESLPEGQFIGGVINPSGFTALKGALPEAIAGTGLAFFEVHASNPSSRDIHSTILPVCQGGICGFGYAGYGLALRAIKER